MVDDLVTERQRRWRAKLRLAKSVASTPVWFDNAKRRRRADHDRQRQLAPAYVLEPIRKLLGGSIGLDPATEVDLCAFLRWHGFVWPGTSPPSRLRSEEGGHAGAGGHIPQGGARIASWRRSDFRSAKACSPLTKA
jgi:hypothetical protein